MDKNVQFSRMSSTEVIVPPHSIDAEQAMLGGVMLDNQAWDDIADIVSEDDLYRHDHKLIFRAIRMLAEAGKPCDAVTISEELQQQQLSAQTGGLVYLANLVRNTPSAANVKAYAEVVRERSVRRSLISLAGKISAGAFEPEGRTSNELIEDADRQLFELVQRGERAASEEYFIGKLLGDAVDRIEERQQNAGKVLGVPTGFRELDEMTGGLHGGQLIVIAGRPSMGKSTFAMNIAENVAIRHRLPCCVFSLEMSKEEITDRAITSTSRVNIRKGVTTDEGWMKVSSAISELKEAPLIIRDTASLTPTELRARGRRMVRKHGVRLIVVDYLQLMHVPGNRENRTVEIGQISRALKGLAKELKVPVIALSQLNRLVEHRTVKRPVMSDLRDSGDIEQDADVIMLIHREDYYDKETLRKGISDVLLVKQRNGPTGDIELLFNGEQSRFDDYAPSEQPDRKW